MQTATITQRPFGTTPNGEDVTEFTLTNGRGSVVKIINFGGVIRSVLVPDNQGKLGDVVLGYDTLEPYLTDSPFIGALVGRYANRLANAQFTLDGITYPLHANNGTNCLHGGLEGFDKRVWAATSFVNEIGAGVELNLLSPDGDQGFPGNLNVKVVYQLSQDDEIIVDYFATTDKPTPINLTQHSYFNLAEQGTILNHQLQVHADYITPITRAQIPTGEFMPVENTPFDFRELRVMGKSIDEVNEQLEFGFGYDHNFVIRHAAPNDLTLAARLEEKNSGRVLEVFTQEPGVQVYTGNWLNATMSGKGIQFERRGGVCLEPEHYPNSPSQSNFPNTILRPGEEYQSRTVFKFSVM